MTTSDYRALAKNWAAEQGFAEWLGDHPNSSNYSTAFPMLMFSAGRMAGKHGLTDDEAGDWTQGILDHVSDCQAEGRRRKREARA